MNKLNIFIFGVILLVGSSCYAQENKPGSIKIKYFWAMPWGIHSVNLVIEDDGSLLLKESSHSIKTNEDHDMGQVVSRIDSNELQALKNKVADLDVFSLQEEYNGCMADLPCSSILFEINQKQKHVSVNEMDKDMLRCKSPQPPEKLEAFIAEIKQIVKKLEKDAVSVK